MIAVKEPVPSTPGLQADTQGSGPLVVRGRCAVSLANSPRMNMMSMMNPMMGMMGGGLGTSGGHQEFWLAVELEVLFHVSQGLWCGMVSMIMASWRNDIGVYMLVASDTHHSLCHEAIEGSGSRVGLQVGAGPELIHVSR